jgi:hypothetical protein
VCGGEPFEKFRLGAGFRSRKGTGRRHDRQGLGPIHSHVHQQGSSQGARSTDASTAVHQDAMAGVDKLLEICEKRLYLGD